MKRRTLVLNIALAVLLIAGIVAAIAALGGSSTPTVAVRTAAVSRGTVTAKVTGSGNSEQSLSTDVNFQNSGTVTAIKVKAGDTVTAGQVLATIDSTSAQQGLRSARADLDNAQAAYAAARSGPTEVKKQQDQLEITKAQQSVVDARAALDSARKQLDLDRTSTAADIESARTTLANDKKSTSTSVDNAKRQLSTDTKTQNDLVSAAQKNLDSCRRSSSTSTTTTTSAAATATATASTTSSSSSSCSSEEQALTSAKNTRTSTLETDRQAVTTAQQTRDSTLDTDEQAVTTAEQKQASTLLSDEKAIQDAQAKVTTAESDVTAAQLTAQADLKPKTVDEIEQARATAAGAQVEVDKAQVTLDQTTLKAPLAGVVLAVNGTIGATAGSSAGSSGSSSGDSTATASASGSSSAFMSIANLSRLAVTADVAEADAAKLRLGQPATVTFSATGSTATGTVTQITPQSTVANNVVKYPVTVALDSAPADAKVGETAGFSVTTGEATAVLKVPSAAITSLPTGTTVTVRRNDIDTVVPVRTGLVGDTETEIIGGLSQGDVLVLPAASGATSSTGGPGGGN